MNATPRPPHNTASPTPFHKKIPQAVWLLLASVVGAVVAVAAVAIFFPDANHINIGFPEGKLELSIERSDVLDHAVLLDTLFARDFVRPAVQEWLKTNEDLYHVEDPAFAERLARLVPHLQNESEIDYAARVTELIENNPLLKDLRTRAERHDPPFQHVGKQVKIGVPASDLSKRYIYVAFDSEFQGRRILLKNPRNGKAIILEGRGGFHKTDNVDFQLHMALASNLFGRVAQETITGLAFILPTVDDPIGDLAVLNTRAPVQPAVLSSR